MRLILALIALLFSNNPIADISQPPGSSKTELPSLEARNLGENSHQLSAKVCQECHQKIYQQWQSSMHAHSNDNPIYQAFYKLNIANKITDNSAIPICLNCHAPNAARDQKTQLDIMPAYTEGVNCLSCHLLKNYQGVLSQEIGESMKLGIAAYEHSDILQSPSGKVFTQMPIPTPAPETGRATPSFHPYLMTGNTALFRSSDICLGCHEQRNNSNGVPLCSTGSEFRAAGSFNCQQCHMPVNQGYADHSMAGGHNQAMLERGVIMTLKAEKISEQIHIQILLNNMLPHKMPTGTAFRNMYLKVSAYNGKGEPLWQNFKKHPLKEDPQAMFMLELLDQNNQASTPIKATKQGKDSRLVPRQKRTLDYTFTAENVAVVRAELHYDLLLPSLKQSLQSLPAELKKSRVIARAEQRVFSTK